MKCFQFVTGIALTAGILFNPFAVQAKPLNTMQTVNLLYDELVEREGSKYTPDFKYGASAGTSTPCGPVSFAGYCPADHTIYMTAEALSLPPGAAAKVLAHEFGHAVLRVTGQNSNLGVVEELRADCIAGWYLSTTSQLAWSKQDVDDMLRITYAAGDTAFLDWENHHGVSEQRVSSLAKGIHGGLNGQDAATVCL